MRIEAAGEAAATGVAEAEGVAAIEAAEGATTGAAATGTDDSGGFRVEVSQQLSARALGEVDGKKMCCGSSPRPRTSQGGVFLTTAREARVPASEQGPSMP